MGVYHILPLGVSPGVVTSPLAYISYQYKRGNVMFFGKDSNRAKVKKTSGIVLFTTRSIMEGKLLERECVDNLIDKRQGAIKAKSCKVIDVVKDYLKKDKDFREMLDDGVKFYWLESRPSEFYYNLTQLIELYYFLSPIGSVGKEIWVNITGGTNVVNIALSMATSLTGVTGRQYYTFVPQDDVKYIRPPELNGEFWCDTPVLKFVFDYTYEIILRILKDVGAMSEEDLLSFAMQEFQKQNAVIVLTNDKSIFRKNYVNKLDGWLTERLPNDDIAISDNGNTLFSLIEDPLVRSFLYKTPLEREPNPALLQEISI